MSARSVALLHIARSRGSKSRVSLKVYSESKLVVERSCSDVERVELLVEPRAVYSGVDERYVTVILPPTVDLHCEPPRARVVKHGGEGEVHSREE